MKNRNPHFLIRILASIARVFRLNRRRLVALSENVYVSTRFFCTPVSTFDAILSTGNETEAGAIEIGKLITSGNYFRNRISRIDLQSTTEQLEAFFAWYYFPIQSEARLALNRVVPKVGIDVPE